jgi:hypothetical protein
MTRVHLATGPRPKSFSSFVLVLIIENENV